MVCCGVSPGQDTAFADGKCSNTYTCNDFSLIVEITDEFQKTLIIGFFKKTVKMITAGNSQRIVFFSTNILNQPVCFDLSVPERTGNTGTEPACVQTDIIAIFAFRPADNIIERSELHHFKTLATKQKYFHIIHINPYVSMFPDMTGL